MDAIFVFVSLRTGSAELCETSERQRYGGRDMVIEDPPRGDSSPSFSYVSHLVSQNKPCMEKFRWLVSPPTEPLISIPIDTATSTFPEADIACCMAIRTRRLAALRFGRFNCKS